jgi:putative membrane protein
VLGALLGFVVVGMVPIQTPNTALVVFGSGVIAISAMILPGISGSFMLVIMGQYKNILSAVTSLDMVTLGVFVAGCFTGLAFFVRFLSWVLSRYHHVTLAVLAGLMFGSLRKLWPWKEVVETRIDETGILVPLIEKNMIPHAMDMSVLGALLLCSLGIVLVLLFQKEKQKNG